MSIVSASTTNTTAYQVTADTTGQLVFQTGSGPSEAVRIDASGNVGIGTSSFSLAGSRNGLVLRAKDANGTELLIQSVNATAGGITGYATAVTGNDVYFVNRLDGFYSWITGASGNTERMRLDASGNIGIGTTVPSSYGKLVVRTAGASTAFSAYTNDTGAALIADLRGYNNTYGEQSRMVVQANGYVGIGSSAPTRFLTIESTGTTFSSASNPSIRLNERSSGRFAVVELDSATNLNIWNGDAGSGNTIFWRGSGSGTESMRIDSVGRVTITGNYGNGAYDSTLPGIYFNKQSNTAETNMPFIRAVTEGVTTSLQLGPSSSSGSLQFWTVSSERMRVTSGGNVGIGTTSPSYKFDVNSTSAGTLVRFTGSGDGGRGLSFISADNGIYLGAIWTRDVASAYGVHAWSVNSAEKVRIDNAGNVGVGTTAPAYKFDVNGRIRGNDVGLGSSSNWYYFDSYGGGNFMGLGGGTNLQFWINAAERMRIDSSGNVGIGRTSPSGKLDVNGRTYIRASGSDTVLTLLNQSGGDGSISVTGTSNTMNYGFSTFSTGNALFIQNDGNIGIGTTAPAARLDVATSSGAAGQVNTHLILTRGTTNGAYLATERAAASNDVSALVFGVNSSERMRINSSGIVTTPYQPAWNLRPNTGVNVNINGEQIIGWSANTTGSSSKACYAQSVTLSGSASGTAGATSSGRLTVPVAGKYKIWVTMRAENMPNAGNIYLYVNGVQIARQHVEVWGSTYGMPYGHGFHSHCLDLAANDYIEISIACSGTLTLEGYNDTVNWFSGHLI